MSIKKNVFDLLSEAKGKPVSGSSMAEKLNVSRNAVWKAIDSLRADGYTIDSSTNKGYTLVSENNILSSESIKKHLKHPSGIPDGIDILVLPTVDSTNNYAKKEAAKGAPEGLVIVSEEQTAGKGRLGRRFESPGKTGIYMSILLRPKFSAQESLSITTASAVAVAKAIEEISGNPAKIKWVNDVYMNEKKVCGILTEASINFETGGLEYAVSGIGINVKYPDGGFPEEISSIAGAVFDSECGDDIRCRLIAAIIDNFFELYNKLPHRAYLEEYRSRSLLTGREVDFIFEGKDESGVVTGIDDSARLLVRLADGTEKALSTGEVVIKKTFLKNHQ